MTTILLIEYGTIEPAIYDGNRQRTVTAAHMVFYFCVYSPAPFNSPVFFLGTPGSLTFSIALGAAKENILNIPSNPG